MERVRLHLNKLRPDKYRCAIIMQLADLAKKLSLHVYVFFSASGKTIHAKSCNVWRLVSTHCTFMCLVYVNIMLS